MRPTVIRRKTPNSTLAWLLLAVILAAPMLLRAQAALLVEEPYGVFGALNPTGHTAMYFERICADTPIHLRRCKLGEMGSVISRYQGISGYDWIALPIVPYLYAVEDTDQVPAHTNRKSVDQLRRQYHQDHLLSLGEDLPEGDFFHGGWKQLIGTAYDRRIYALRFHTTVAQDEALIELLNTRPNESHFQLLYSNCADFAREILSYYYPKHFHRSIFPDAGMTTPKQIAYKLERLNKHNDSVQLR